MVKIIKGLRTAERQGKNADSPEGSRYVTISDTLANRWADSLETTRERIEISKQIAFLFGMTVGIALTSCGFLSLTAMLY